MKRISKWWLAGVAAAALVACEAKKEAPPEPGPDTAQAAPAIPG